MVAHVTSAYPMVVVIVMVPHAVFEPVSIGWRIEDEQRNDRRNQRRT